MFLLEDFLFCVLSSSGTSFGANPPFAKPWPGKMLAPPAAMPASAKALHQARAQACRPAVGSKCRGAVADHAARAVVEVRATGREG